MMAKYVGASIKRREDPRFIQGQGRYVANIELPNMAHLAIVRSPSIPKRLPRSMV
jgi:carbon-monoxide dehydrogenase large subunit